MRIGVDTNVLVEAHVPGGARHAEARSYLLEQLGTSDVTIVVTPLVLHEFVHVVTDSRRFAHSPPMTEAIAMAGEYMTRDNVECAPVDTASMQLALEMLERHRLGRNRISDCLLAATLLTHGVHRLATFNARDFALFAPLMATEPGT